MPTTETPKEPGQPLRPEELDRVVGGGTALSLKASTAKQAKKSGRRW